MNLSSRKKGILLHEIGLICLIIACYFSFLLFSNGNSGDDSVKNNIENKAMAYELPSLSYSFNALEPHIDAQTMELHYSKHHQAYVNNLNAALVGLDSLSELKPMKLIQNLDKVPEGVRTAVRNNGGGHVNHTLLWKMIAPGGAKAPTGELAAAIDRDFGSFEKFQAEFTKAALSRFGSGWAWLCTDENGKLAICSTANQDNPLMGKNYGGCGLIPILGIDVWEHAYYLKFQNRRVEYIDAFYKVINWDFVAKRYANRANQGCCGGNCSNH